MHQTTIAIDVERNNANNIVCDNVRIVSIVVRFVGNNDGGEKQAKVIP